MSRRTGRPKAAHPSSRKKRRASRLRRSDGRRLVRARRSRCLLDPAGQASGRSAAGSTRARRACPSVPDQRWPRPNSWGRRVCPPEPQVRQGMQEGTRQQPVLVVSPLPPLPVLPLLEQAEASICELQLPSPPIRRRAEATGARRRFRPVTERSDLQQRGELPAVRLHSRGDERLAAILEHDHVTGSTFGAGCSIRPRW
jgi:hypothetical protein